MEMGDHEISIGYVNVDAKTGQKQSGQAPDGEQTDKAERVEHRGIV